MKKPQFKAIVLKILTMKPKKPNSANRKIAKVKIKGFNKIFTCFIPGEGHNLSIHSLVLIKGGKTPDLPGVKLKIIRGALDCSPVKRLSSRSKYGNPKPSKG